MGFSRSAPLTGGGTISGDLTITGDLTVSGGGSLTYDETVSGTMIIDNDYTATTSDTERVLYVDFDKSGVTASSQTANITGLALQLNDGATNHVSGTVNMTGLDLDVVSASNQGTTTNVGLNVNVSGADTNHAAIFNGGKVGIGGTPTSDLHVFGTEVRIAGDTSALVLQDTSGFQADTGCSLYFQGVQNGGTLQTFAEILGVSTDTANQGDLIFKTRNAGATNEVMRIDHLGLVSIGGSLDIDGTANLDNVDVDGTFTQDGGNVVFNEDSGDYDFRVESNGSANMLFVDGGENRVGIGTGTPDCRFQVVDTSNMKYENNQLTLTRVGSGHLLTLLNADTTISDNEALGYVRFEGNENGAGQVTGGSIEVHCEKDWSGNSDCPTRMTFWTTPDGAANATEKMRIDEAGVLTLTAGQINFPDTQSASADANTLDDYQEGTWTPAWTQGFSATTYNLQHGKYVKVGGLITVWGCIGMTADAGGGNVTTPSTAGDSTDNLRLNLPESAVSGMNNFIGAAVVQTGASMETESAYIRCGTASGASNVAFFVGQADGADGQTHITGQDIGASGLINFQISYQTT